MEKRKTEKIIYNNEETNTLCSFAVDREYGECFVKVFNYGRFSQRKQRESCLALAKSEAKTLCELSEISALAGKVPALYEHYDNKAKGQYVIVMEKMKGKTLREWMGDHPASAMDQKGFYARRKIVQQICEIMRTINKRHSRIVHRDLKPENVIIRMEDKRWKVAVIDFGCAGLNFARKLGTRSYCAPEQHPSYCESLSTNYGAHTDIFAIGQIYYELLLGEAQAFGVHYVKSRGRAEWEKRPCLSEALQKMPGGKDIDNLLKRMTEFDPECRKYEISYDRIISVLK